MKWDELDIHQPEVTELEKIRERKNQDRTFQFLANLDQSFEQVRQQILLGTSLPSLEEIVSTLEQEESRRSAMNSDTPIGDRSESQAFLSNHQNQSRKPNSKGGDAGSTRHHQMRSLQEGRSQQRRVLVPQPAPPPEVVERRQRGWRRQRGRRRQRRKRERQIE